MSPMVVDSLLATFHFVAIFAMFAIIVLEWGILLQPLKGKIIARLAMFDLHYLFAALLTITAGFLRVFYGIKGSSYYFSSHIFWTKMLLLVFVALISIIPTRKYLRWRKAYLNDPEYVVPKGDQRGVKLLVMAQVILLFLVLPTASFMARGFGVL